MSRGGEKPLVLGVGEEESTGKRWQRSPPARRMQPYQVRGPVIEVATCFAEGGMGEEVIVGGPPAPAPSLAHARVSWRPDGAAPLVEIASEIASRPLLMPRGHSEWNAAGWRPRHSDKGLVRHRSSCSANDRRGAVEHARE
jgi:hypothetical protein